jgi:pantoate--beta-alanine ligase
MLFIESIPELRSQIKQQKSEGKVVCFVPTMGNLHEGHLQLIDLAKKQGDFVVCSIFVNPTQFGEGEDFDSYPRTLEVDQNKLQSRGCDLLFFPKTKDMYASGLDKSVLTKVHVPGVSQGLCGGSRPGHFDGVATVVSKLFNLVSADKAIFGEKDYQQLAVIRKFTKDLNFDIEIIGAPIVREENGLAMSSRNGYLSDEEKSQAAFLFQLLSQTKEKVLAGEKDIEGLCKNAINSLAEKGFKPDYFEIRNAETLEPCDKDTTLIVILLAACLGKTRLIDNTSFARE